MTVKLRGMGKKKPAASPPPEKEVLYLEVEPSLRVRLRRLGSLPHRRRTMTAEAIIAIYAYLAAEEAKEGLAPAKEDE